MCARRFLFAIFILTLLVVAGAFAIFQWGGNVLLKSATPVGHFDAAKAGDGPDYSLPPNWVDHPQLRVSPSLWRPTGVTASPPGPAAIFYVHPTTYLERDRWNAPACDGEECGEAGKKAELFVRSQASALSNSGTMWAPRYRQAAYGAFLLDSRDAQKAIDLAYGDVLRAFDQFLSANPKGPLILAGHSQGSLHLLRLLADRRGAIRGRLVAAYVVGWPVSRTADLPGIGLKPCARPDEVGCLMSWQSFAQPANPALVLDAWEKMPGRAGPHRRRDIICTNPLTGTVDGVAGPIANPGTLVPAADLADARLVAGQVGAQCRDGLLLIDGAIPAMGPYVLPGNNYHVYDYALFWAALAKDAFNRTIAWR